MTTGFNKQLNRDYKQHTVCFLCNNDAKLMVHI